MSKGKKEATKREGSRLVPHPEFVRMVATPTIEAAGDGNEGKLPWFSKVAWSRNSGIPGRAARLVPDRGDDGGLVGHVHRRPLDAQHAAGIVKVADRLRPADTSRWFTWQGTRRGAW